MKVGVYLVDDLTPSAGGGFTYTYKLINAIDNFTFAEPIEICFLGRTAKPGISFKKGYIALSSYRRNKFFHILKRFMILRILSALFGGNFDWSNTNDLKILREKGVKLILYPKQFSPLIDAFPFLTMNWDVGHKSTFIFPEFTSSIDYRENWYRAEVQKALGIIVESQAGKQECLDYLQVNANKIDVVPLFAGHVIEMNTDEVAQSAILNKYNLESLRYFFYPAQFWAHKNHYNLLKAFRSFRDNNAGSNIRLVLTGSDNGNKDYIKQVINDLGLQDDVSELGFVDDNTLFSLYKHTISLVMPSFLGPTNMPPLEAMALSVPVICSDLTGHREMCEDAAIYADPADPLQWANAMNSLLDKATRDQFIKRGSEVYKRSIFKIDAALKHLERILLKYTRIRNTFR